jgi:hypothetical protein
MHLILHENKEKRGAFPSAKRGMVPSRPKRSHDWYKAWREVFAARAECRSASLRQKATSATVRDEQECRVNTYSLLPYLPSSIPIEAQMNPCTSIRECGFNPRFCNSTSTRSANS